MAGRDKFVEQIAATAEAHAAYAAPSAWRSAELLHCAGLGAAGALLIIAFSRSWLGALAALLFAAVAVALGLRLAALGRLRCDALRARHAAAQHDLRALYARLFPVWGRQITTCRESADEAVAQLARNFSGMG